MSIQSDGHGTESLAIVKAVIDLAMTRATQSDDEGHMLNTPTIATVLRVAPTVLARVFIGLTLIERRWHGIWR